MGQNTKYILITTWVLALITAIFVGVNFYDKVSHTGTQIKTETIALMQNDTLKVRFAKNEFYTKEDNYDVNFSVIKDSLQNEIMYSNNVTLVLKTTNKTKPYFTIEKSAKGSSLDDANECANKIKYAYKIVGNEIIFNNYFTSEVKEELRNQQIKIYLFLPEGTVYQPLGNTFDYTDDYKSDLENFNDQENKLYKVSNDQINCVNCPADDDEDNEDGFDIKVKENDENGNNNEDVNVKINGKDFLKTTTTKKDSSEQVKIELNGKELINTETKKVNRKN